MSTVRQFSCTGLTTGSALTTTSQGTGDNTFNDVDSGFTIATGGLRSPRIKLADGSGQAQFIWNIPAATAYAVRWYGSTGAATGALCRGYNAADGGGSVLWRVDFNSNGYLRLIPAGTGVAWASSTALPLNTSLRFELTVDASGNGHLNVYTGDGTSPIMGGGGSVGAGTMLSVGFGRVTSAATSTGLYFDDLAVANTATEIGPAAAPVTTNPVLSRLNADGTLTPYIISTL